MTASERAKSEGFKSLTQVAEIYGCTTEKLRYVLRNKPHQFDIIIHGCKWWLIILIISIQILAGLACTLLKSSRTLTLGRLRVGGKDV